MSKYHIAKDGKPALCRATTKACPLGGIHGTLEEVQKEIDKQHKEEFGILASTAPNINLHSEIERTFKVQVDATESFTELTDLAKNLKKAYEINDISKQSYEKLNKEIDNKKEKTPVSKLADGIMSKAKIAEPQISNDLEELKELTNSELVGLEFKFKAKDSLGRKLEAKGTLGEKPDALRYTFQSTPHDYTKAHNTIKKELLAKGYSQAGFTNFWDIPEVGYQGINSWYTSPDGYTFEVQFHTPSSHELKEKILHPIYEEQRKLETGSPKALELEQKMIELGRKVTPPRNIENIK